METVQSKAVWRASPDIYGLILAQSAIEQDALLLAAFVESSEDAIFTTTPDGLITSWNPGAERLYGCKAAEALGRQVSFLIPPDCVEELARIMTRVQRGERVEQFETVRLHQDGTRIDVALTVSPIRDGNGRLVGISKIARNITVQRQAGTLALAVETARRRTLLQSNDRIEALEQKARELARFVEATRQNTLLQADKKTEALEQKARDLADFVEALQNQTRLQSDTEIEALGQKARDLAVFVESVRKETRLQSEMEIVLLGNQARDLAVSVENVREETLLQMNSDISVSRKLKEELEHRVLERTGQLETANKELESFCYSVSHDLRAPLRAIDGFSRIVLEDYAAVLPDEGKGYLKLVRDNTRQMGQLVDDLLAFSRLGRQALTKHTVEPGKIVRMCLTEMQTEQEGRNLEIVINDLPVCQADRTLLKQVWTNLLSNALKYTRKRDAARIVIGCRTEPRPSESGKETVYFVKDNGAGFDMKYADKLFGVFQRLHRAADYEGTGVGLAIVQRIISRHGGRIWADAQPNQGAMFSFTLE